VHAAVGWSGAGGAEFPFLWLMVLVLIILQGGAARWCRAPRFACGMRTFPDA
jgi:hypothetical protein